MKHIGVATLVAAACLAVPVAALAAAPATNWMSRQMTVNMSECLNRARQSHVRAGSTNINVSDDSVRGYRGNTVGVMVCLPNKDMLFIYTAGPTAGETSLYRNALWGGF